MTQLIVTVEDVKEGQYLKDLKLARRRRLDGSKLNEIILKLISGKELPG